VKKGMKKYSANRFAMNDRKDALSQFAAAADTFKKSR
jgi:hypothetical protein